jgi:cation diffusion facilitator family transporter
MKSCCENKASELNALRSEQGKILKIVLLINAVMFIVEFTMGWRARSSALMADSLDMFGDALVYGFSLYVLNKSVQWRSTAALLKGVIISAFGLIVLAEVGFKLFSDVVPKAETMGFIGTLALVANLVCLQLLLKHKNDDLNMRSTFICSRNDIISNVGVLLAAIVVSFTQSKWPDIIIGLTIATLFLRSAFPIITESLAELKAAK